MTSDERRVTSGEGGSADEAVEVGAVGEVEEVDDVGVGEADAAVGGGRAELLLLVGAVQVDAALVAVGARPLVDAGFEAFEPDHAREDGVLGRVGRAPGRLGIT